MQNWQYSVSLQLRIAKATGCIVVSCDLFNDWLPMRATAHFRSYTVGLYNRCYYTPLQCYTFNLNEFDKPTTLVQVISIPLHIAPLLPFFIRMYFPH